MPLKQRSCHPVQWKSMKTTFIWHGIYPNPFIICSIAIGCTSYQHSPVGSTRCSTNVQITPSDRINNFQASKLLEEILDQLIASFSLLCCGFYDEPSIHFSNICVCKFGSGRLWTYLFQLPSKNPKQVQITEVICDACAIFVGDSDHLTIWFTRLKLSFALFRRVSPLMQRKCCYSWEFFRDAEKLHQLPGIPMTGQVASLLSFAAFPALYLNFMKFRL